MVNYFLHSYVDSVVTSFVIPEQFATITEHVIQYLIIIVVKETYAFLFLSFPFRFKIICPIKFDLSSTGIASIAVLKLCLLN